MPDDEATTPLRFGVSGGISVQDFLNVIGAVETAYNGLVACETVIEGARAAERQGLPPSWWHPSHDLGPVLASRQFDSSMLVMPGDRLVLSAAQIESPGWVEVLGKLNPLEQLRQYLNDRHERKKDNAYRNDLEKRRAQLENELLTNQIIAGRVEMLRNLGVPEHEIVLMLNVLVAKPVGELARLQDQGLLALHEGDRNA